MSDPVTVNSLLEVGTGLEQSAPTPPYEHNGFSRGTRRSATIGKLVAALCKARLEFEPVVKGSVNPQFRSKYADLAAVLNATMPALAKNELAVIQTPYVEGNNLTVTTMLVHSSDEWISSELTLPATMRDTLTAQTVASATSYARRYGVSSMLCLGAEDDDGEQASGGGTKEAAQAVAQSKIKTAVESGKAAALFYAQDSEDKTKFYVTGDVKLLQDNKELLLFRGKWSNKQNAFVTDADGLESYKYELNERGVPFLQQGAKPLTQQLTESIAQAKAKRQPGSEG